MKYKLINNKTKEEHLCDKVTIDGFDYYVSEKEATKLGDFCYAIKSNNLFININPKLNSLDKRKVIVTNNPNIDIPKVVCNIDLTKLCHYDRRNPDFSIKEEYGYDKEEVEATGNFAKKDCACDNCFYGRSVLTEQLIKAKETHPFSEEDMIEFAEWCQKPSLEDLRQPNVVYIPSDNFYWHKHKKYTPKELLQLWKEQRPKIVYYG